MQNQRINLNGNLSEGQSRSTTHSRKENRPLAQKEKKNIQIKLRNDGHYLISIVLPIQGLCELRDKIRFVKLQSSGSQKAFFSSFSQNYSRFLPGIGLGGVTL